MFDMFDISALSSADCDKLASAPANVNDSCSRATGTKNNDN